MLAAAGRSHSGVGNHVAACAAQRRMRPCTSARWPAGSAASQGSAPAAAAHGLAGARRRRRVERGRGAPAPVAQERALLERLVQRRTRADHHPAFQVIARPCLEANRAWPGLAWASRSSGGALTGRVLVRAPLQQARHDRLDRPDSWTACSWIGLLTGSTARGSKAEQRAEVGNGATPPPPTPHPPACRPTWRRWRRPWSAACRQAAATAVTHRQQGPPSAYGAWAGGRTLF